MTVLYPSVLVLTFTAMHGARGSSTIPSHTANCMRKAELTVLLRNDTLLV